MTAAERDNLYRLIIAALRRAERAERLGDHAGHLIAAGDARRTIKLMTAAAMSLYGGTR